jgi:hypothetical protein
MRILTEAARSRFEFDALDLAPAEPGVLARLAGPAAALPELARELCALWPGELISEDAATAIWTRLRELTWANAEAPLVKVALSPSHVVPLGEIISALPDARCHVSAGGNVAYVSLGAPQQSGQFDEKLMALRLLGVTLRGEAPLWLGARSRPQIARAVKEALDPENRFPSLDD